MLKYELFPPPNSLSKNMGFPFCIQVLRTFLLLLPFQLQRDVERILQQPEYSIPRFPVSISPYLLYHSFYVCICTYSLLLNQYTHISRTREFSFAAQTSSPHLRKSRLTSPDIEFHIEISQLPKIVLYCCFNCSPILNSTKIILHLPLLSTPI